MNIFIKSSHAPRKTPNDPQAENHWCTITMFLALLLPKAAPSLQRTGIEFRNTIAGLTLTLIVISQYWKNVNFEICFCRLYCTFKYYTCCLVQCVCCSQDNFEYFYMKSFCNTGTQQLTNKQVCKSNPRQLAQTFLDWNSRCMQNRWNQDTFWCPGLIFLFSVLKWWASCLQTRW